MKSLHDVVAIPGLETEWPGTSVLLARKEKPKILSAPCTSNVGQIANHSMPLSSSGSSSYLDFRNQLWYRSPSPKFSAIFNLLHKLEFMKYFFKFELYIITGLVQN